MTAPAHHLRMPLIQTETVRDLTGLRADEIRDLVTGGTLTHRGLAWVWDFSAQFPGNQNRDLRFWRDEALAHCSPDSTKQNRFGNYQIGWVIDRVLPRSRANFHSGELLAMFALERPSLLRLRDEMNGRLAGARNALFPRASVAAFLERRWLGAVHSSGGTQAPAAFQLNAPQSPGGASISPIANRK
ncbi:MAG TPA: hypothetical protein VIK53_19470 [Verrucomicrobiae bacterium]